MKTENTKPVNDIQAFPQTWMLNRTTENWENGMTLRDYFAGKSDIPWNALIETLEIKNPELKGKITVRMVLELRAEYKYLEADAMLKQREL